MKLLIVIVLIILSSCSLQNDIYYTISVGNHSLYYSQEWENLTSYIEISNWICKHIEYKADDEDIWSDPEVTLNRGYGDCDDLALLFICIAYFALDIEMDFIVVDHTRHIIEGGRVDHAMVYYNGYVIEPNSGFIENNTIGYIYYFKQIW